MINLNKLEITINSKQKLVLAIRTVTQEVNHFQSDSTCFGTPKNYQKVHASSHTSVSVQEILTENNISMILPDILLSSPMHFFFVPQNQN